MTCGQRVSDKGVTLKMRIESRKILKRVVSAKDSPLFLSKNAYEIGKFLKRKGFDVEESEIKEYLAEQKSVDIVIKNHSEKKTSELSRPVVLPPNYFEWLQVDLCVLSKNHAYGRSSSRYVLILMCGLSLFTYYAPCYGTRSSQVIQSFQSIFDRSPFVPERSKKVWGDLGIEWRSAEITKFFRRNGLKFYGVAANRLGRKGRGNVYAEQGVRLLRYYLQTYLKDVGNDVPFAQKLLEIETAVNSKPRTSLNGMSSRDVLNEDPLHVRNIKASNRFRRRKSLRKNVVSPAKLPLFAIVKVRRFAKKDGLGTKEAYGSVSRNYYCVIDVENRDHVDCHLLGSVFDLQKASDSLFSYAELKYYPEMTIPRARYYNVMNNSEIIRRDSDHVYMKPDHCNETFYAAKDALK